MICIVDIIIWSLHILDLDISLVWILSVTYPIILISDNSIEHLHDTFAGPICQKDKFRVPANAKHNYMELNTNESIRVYILLYILLSHVG